MDGLSLCLAVTAHLALPGDWNGIHPCIRYEKRHVAVGAYLNSERTVSAYAALVGHQGPLFGEIGLVTGYSDYDVLPFVRAGIEKGRFKYFIAPGFVGEKVGVVLGIEARLN